MAAGWLLSHKQWLEMQLAAYKLMLVIDLEASHLELKEELLGRQILCEQVLLLSSLLSPRWSPNTASCRPINWGSAETQQI